MAYPKCEICGKESVGVCCSCMGAISHSYCEECLNEGREVWTTLIGGLYGLTKKTMHPDIQFVIDATCKFYNKTEDELWQEVEQLEKDYDDYMRREWERNQE